MNIKIGDQLETTISFPAYSLTPGTILTVKKVLNDTWNTFYTNDPIHGSSCLYFWDAALTTGNLKPISYINYQGGRVSFANEGIKPLEKINLNPVCECGKDKHGFASHSNWCGKA